MMELLNQIFAIIFYAMVFSWAFLKMRNVILIKKMNYQDIYKKIKKDIRQQKIPKCLFILILIIISIFWIYLAIGLASGALAIFMIFITLGGAAYVDAGGDSTFYENLLSFVGKYFSLFKYIHYYMYFIAYIILISAIYINILSYKMLKSKDIIENISQNVSK